MFAFFQFALPCMYKDINNIQRLIENQFCEIKL